MNLLVVPAAVAPAAAAASSVLQWCWGLCLSPPTILALQIEHSQVCRIDNIIMKALSDIMTNSTELAMPDSAADYRQALTEYGLVEF